MAAGYFLEEEAEPKREEHWYEEEEGGVVETVEAGLWVRAHDAVCAESGEAREEEEEPVLRGFDGEVGRQPKRKHTRERVNTVETGDGAVDSLRCSVRDDPWDPGAREFLHED